jgi:hypothetical protein
MPKKEKKVPIQVTARFEITFTHQVTEEQFKKMDKEDYEVSDFVDESVAYNLLRSDGDCEMEWDYAPKLKKAKRP